MTSARDVRTMTVWLGLGLIGVLAALSVRVTFVPWLVPTRATANRFAFAVALAALACSVWGHGRGRSHRLFPALRVMLAVLSVLAWVNLGDVQFPYHRWEQFHYYLGGKYFPELGYSRLYTCTAVAEAQSGGSALVSNRRLRDLTTDTIVSARAAVEAPDECVRRFTPARWQQFVADVAWFSRDTPRGYWFRMQQDHGFNAPPSWAVAGGLLTGMTDAGPRTQAVLALIDPLLLCVMFGSIGWAFGWDVLWVALVVWGCQMPSNGGWTASALLRQDWLCALVAGVCLLKRQRPMAAGVALATAAALRIFPALLLAVPLVGAVRLVVRQRRLSRAYRRFGLGLMLGGVVWFGSATVLYGPDTWVDFAAHMRRHTMAPLANHLGLHALLSQTIEGRLAVSEDPLAVDPYHRWKEGRRAAFAARQPLYASLLAGIALLTLAAGWRIRPLWCALPASALVVMSTLDLASYYYAFCLILALLAAVRPAFEWWALGAVVVGRGVALVPFLYDNVDLRFAAQTPIYLAWGCAVLVLLGSGRVSRAGIIDG